MKRFTFIIMIFYCLQVQADKRCLKGNDPSEQQLNDIQHYRARIQEEMDDLAKKIAKETQDNTSLKKEWEQKHGLRFNKAIIGGEIWKEIELTENLDYCLELNLSDEEFKVIMQNWLLVSARYPTNQEYIYNYYTTLC